MFATGVLSSLGLSLSGCSRKVFRQQTSEQEPRTPGTGCDGPPKDQITVVNRTPEPVVAQVSVEDEESRVVFQEEISLQADDEADATSPSYSSDTVITEPGTYHVTVQVKEPYTLTHESQREYTYDCDQWEILVKQGDVDDVKIPLEG